MKTTIPASRPRNPLVAAARLRRAGAHRPTGGALRQQAGRELRRDLERSSEPPQHCP